MPIYFDINQDNDQLTLNVKGHFDSRLTLEIRHLYQTATPTKKIIVDFRHTEFIDSSGLGLLIGMKKHFDCSKENFRLTRCSATMKKFFNAVRFDKLFIIE